MNNILYSPQNLQTLGQLPLHLTGHGLEAMDQFKRADADTLQELMAQRQRAAQTHTADMAQKGATLEQTMLGNRAKTMDNQVRAATLPQEIQAKFDEFTKKADDHQWSMFESKIKNGLQSPDPTTRAQAQAMYDQLPAQIEKRRQYSHEMEKEREGTRRATSVAKIGADSRREIADIRAQQARELQEIRNAASGGGNLSLTQLVAKYIDLAQQQQDPQMREYYMNLANTTAAVAAQMTPAGQAPQINPSALPPGTPLQAPPQPTLPAAPQRPAAATKAPPTQADLEFTAKKYGITVEEVKKRLGMQ